MCYLINHRFFRHVVNPTATTYQQGILAIEHLFHASNAASNVIGKLVDFKTFSVRFV